MNTLMIKDLSAGVLPISEQLLSLVVRQEGNTGESIPGTHSDSLQQELQMSQHARDGDTIKSSAVVEQLERQLCTWFNYQHERGFRSVVGTHVADLKIRIDLLQR